MDTQLQEQTSTRYDLLISEIESSDGNLSSTLRYISFLSFSFFFLNSTRTVLLFYIYMLQLSNYSVNVAIIASYVVIVFNFILFVFWQVDIIVGGFMSLTRAVSFVTCFFLLICIIFSTGQFMNQQTQTNFLNICSYELLLMTRKLKGCVIITIKALLSLYEICCKLGLWWRS